MKNDDLTIKNALKYARHDFLNELQLILLNLDLGKVPETKQAILKATDKMRQVSALEKLGLPATEMWLVTFGWVYSAFSASLKCEIVPGVRHADDMAVASLLEHVFNEAEKFANPAIEYEMVIDVHATANDWTIHMTVNGEFENKITIPEEFEDFTVQQSISNHQWTFTIRGQ